jgi:hypothetical protein
MRHPPFFRTVLNTLAEPCERPECPISDPNPNRIGAKHSRSKTPQENMELRVFLRRCGDTLTATKPRSIILYLLGAVALRVTSIAQGRNEPAPITCLISIRPVPMEKLNTAPFITLGALVGQNMDHNATLCVNTTAWGLSFIASRVRPSRLPSFRRHASLFSVR